jgi:hypothetical protein
MIEQRCVLGDVADEVEQGLVQSEGSQKVTAAEVQRQLQDELSSAGLLPNASRVTVTDRIFVEITLHDAPKLCLAKEIMQEQIGVLEKRGISLTHTVRALWVVNHVHFMGVGRSLSGEFINVLRFKAELRSGQARSEVEVRVDARALDRLLKRLGMGVGHIRHPNNGTKHLTITKVIEELLAVDLSLGGTDYWDPVRFPRWELGEKAMDNLFRKECAPQPPKVSRSTTELNESSV